ncbi:TPA: hypothetical protein N0F65_012486 [Lagenidium giganteum]|uniref:HAT C-terminal dimerisation domain-containing protein n=1 Tax=Lagenidium giganteum TaxID=4803 RepID=A0AAV2YQP1_9STRA|nr:TPA: hypothetical protein N0F65_012486 [Lagenidium giganteum]
MACEAELLQYIQTSKSVSRSTNPLGWWCTNASQFSLLAVLA